jgi:hypothetical protein
MIERYKFDNQGCVGRRVQKDEPDYYECRMTEADDGQYSKHSDCAALEKERDALAERLRWKPLKEFTGPETLVLLRERMDGPHYRHRTEWMTKERAFGDAEFLEIPQ